jgi:hypothetical protein
MKSNWKTDLIKFYESSRLDKLVMNICKTHKYKDDLKQELIVILLDMDKRKLGRLLRSDQIYFWSYTILKNQYYSKSSHFFKNYLNFHSDNELVSQLVEHPDENRVQELLIDIDRILDEKVDFFSAFLFRKYYFDWWDENKEKCMNGRSLRKIESEYTLDKDFKIDHMFIWVSVKETLELIKGELRIDQK